MLADPKSFWDYGFVVVLVVIVLVVIVLVIVILVVQTTKSKAEETQIPLKLLVDKERNRVVFAEADYNFVDVLFSFMTLPLGTIVRLIKKNSGSRSIGCLNSLYEGIENLPSQYFSTDECKFTLLHPRNASEFKCCHLKLNVDDNKYFICENWQCSRQENNSGFFSLFNTKKCNNCGKLLKREIGPRDPNVPPYGGVFVSKTAHFMVTDDLCVMPSLPSSSIRVLDDLGITNRRLLEERTVNICLHEVLKLLELALVSRSPLTDLFLCKKTNVQHPVQSKPVKLPRPKSTGGSLATSMKMDVRVFVQKSNGKFLFLQAEESFVDFLFCFLIIPLGKVVGILSGNTSAGCIDELYHSISKLKVFRNISVISKDILLNPQLSWHYNDTCINEIFAFKPPAYPSYFCHSYSCNKQLAGYLCLSRTWNDALEEECSTLISKDQCSFENFVRGPEMFMVTNDLVVMPLTSLSGMSFLDKLEVPFSDVEEHEVRFGINEALRLLKAALTSSTALSSSIDDLFLKIPKQEQK